MNTLKSDEIKIGGQYVVISGKRKNEVGVCNALNGLNVELVFADNNRITLNKRKVQKYIPGIRDYAGIKRTIYRLEFLNNANQRLTVDFDTKEAMIIHIEQHAHNMSKPVYRIVEIRQSVPLEIKIKVSVEL